MFDALLCLAPRIAPCLRSLPTLCALLQSLSELELQSVRVVTVPEGCDMAAESAVTAKTAARSVAGNAQVMAAGT